MENQDRSTSLLSQANQSQERLPTYGGQALIEGVMMRGARAVAAAFRAPDGSVIVHTEQLSGIYKSKWIKVPFIRGLVGLWDALGLGMRFLTMSANIQSGENEKIEGKEMVLTLGASLLIAVGLFFATPAFLGHLTERYLGLSGFASNIVEGIIRLGAIIGYIWLVGKMPEIARVFAYHGAEHKTINAYEARTEMTPQKVLLHSLEHPRCGTASYSRWSSYRFCCSLLWDQCRSSGAWLPASYSSRFWPGWRMNISAFTARHIDNPIVRLLVKPGLALQSMTTREPDAGMAEIAITAFNAMLAEEKRLSGVPQIEEKTEPVLEPEVTT
jgi:uncharacterized protein YqhQ